jgi:hypothetical protein
MIYVKFFITQNNLYINGLKNTELEEITKE